MGSLMAGASHNRPGGRLGGSAGTALLVGLAGARAAAGRINGQWEEGDPWAPEPGRQGWSALDPWGLWLPLQPGLLGPACLCLWVYHGWRTDLPPGLWYKCRNALVTRLD